MSRVEDMLLSKDIEMMRLGAALLHHYLPRSQWLDYIRTIIGFDSWQYEFTLLEDRVDIQYIKNTI